MKYIFVSLLLILSAAGHSQESVQLQAIKLRFNKKKIHLAAIPFDKVQVLDNRFDKSRVFIDQTGQYPIPIFNLAMAGKAIEDYFDEVVRQFSNGKDTLVVNVQELNVANRRMLIERKGDKTHRKTFGTRHYIRLIAVCYLKDRNKLYRKLVSIDKKYYTYYPAVPIQKTIEEILNDIIQSASIGLNVENTNLISQKRLRHLINDSASFRYESDRTFNSEEEINAGMISKWKYSPILNQNNLRHGSYQTFEDFKKDSLGVDRFYIRRATKDSLFKISVYKKDSVWKLHLPYAVVDSGKYYIQIFDSLYVLANRQSFTFYFYVPWSLPDMYALLSIDEVRARNSGNLPVSGNIVADLVGLVGSSLIDEIAKTSEERKIMKEGLKHSFRHCVINMNSGDFIYSNSNVNYDSP